ncbi:Eukaryotic-type carbonic anhydrase family protein [Aphelenchoides avenae]|nr:Eukaryotic-type carbonic anhydrase family protein [Aphelenchus avenae]
MRYIVFAVLLCAAAALLKLSAAGSWSYDEQEDWPGVCETGKSQSPINIRSGDADRVNVAELRFHNYDTKGRFSVTSDGESIPVVRVHGFAAWKKRPYIDGGGLDGSYTLDEIYFVWKRTGFGKNYVQVSEHSIDGHHYPIEIHMVHRSKVNGQEHIAIVAVLVDPWGNNGVNQLDGLFKTIAQTGDGKC